MNMVVAAALMLDGLPFDMLVDGRGSLKAFQRSLRTAEVDLHAVAAGRSANVAGSKLKVQRCAAANTEFEDRNNGGENRHHNRDGTTGPRKSPAFLSLVEI